ncbi:hypothetical protein B7463_g6705, partial [Scytalidium lignicola]
MHVFLDNPNLKPENRADTNLKHRALTQFELKNRQLYRLPDLYHPEPRYAIQDSEVFDIIAQEHIKLLYAGRDKVWPVIEQNYYGIKRVQYNNGKEFKGAFLIILCKYGIRIINGKPRTPQTQGLVEQANGLDSQKHKDLTIEVLQEDPNQPSIFESNIEPELPIDPQLLSLSNSKDSPEQWYNTEANIQTSIKVDSPMTTTTVTATIATATATITTTTTTMATATTVTTTATATTTTTSITVIAIQSTDPVIQKA